MKVLSLFVSIFYSLPQNHIFYFRELGYNGASEHRIESHFGEVSEEFAMDDVQCSGNEASIFDCSYTTEENCDANEGLGVICSGSFEIKANNYLS